MFSQTSTVIASVHVSILDYSKKPCPEVEARDQPQDALIVDKLLAIYIAELYALLIFS